MLKFVMHLCSSEFYIITVPIFRTQTSENDAKYLWLYNKKVIALTLVNIVPSWDIKGCELEDKYCSGYLRMQA